MIVTLVFILSLILTSSNDIKSFKFYIKEKDYDNQIIINHLSDEVDKLKQDNKYLNADKLN